MIYHLPVEWTMSASMPIEAESLQEAMVMADKLELPKGEYMNDSFEIRKDVIPELNQLGPADARFLTDEIEEHGD